MTLYCYCFTAALLLLYCCFAAALLLLYCRFTAALLQVRCAGVGRFVSVLLPGPRRFLSLCEVQVWAEESARMRVDQDQARAYSVYLLYWYKSTNTDAAARL